MSKTILSLAISILLLSLGSAGSGSFPAISLQSVHAVTRNLTLEGWSGGWNQTTSPNPTISVVQGDSVALALPNLDGARHQFFIDVDRNLALPPNCPPDKCSDELPVNYEFTVDFAPGTYKYYCAFHSEQMQGDFAVRGFTVSSNLDSVRVIRTSSNVSTITVASVNNFADTVNLTVTVSPNGPIATLNPTDVALSAGGTATSLLNVSATGTVLMGSYVVTVTARSGSSSSSRGIVALVVKPDFNISANPTFLTIPLDSSRNSTVTLTSRDTFFGTIGLTTNTPASIRADVNPSSVTLISGGTTSSTLNVTVSSPTVPGTYMVNVTGTSEFLTHTTTITVVAGRDFGIASDPAELTLTPDSSETSIITLTSFASFAGTVDLTGSVSPGVLGFSLSPQTVSLSGVESATVLLAVNASAATPAGVYTITVKAASDSTTHSVPITVSVVDFSITVSNTNLILQQGSSVTTTISLTSINGFAGDVNLTAASSTNALSQLLNATMLTLKPSGPRIATLTVNAASAPTGTYTVSITGTSGSLARSISMSITVQPSPVGASILPLVGEVVAGAIAIAMAGTYLVRRGKLRRKAAS